MSSSSGAAFFLQEFQSVFAENSFQIPPDLFRAPTGDEDRFICYKKEPFRKDQRQLSAPEREKFPLPVVTAQRGHPAGKILTELFYERKVFCNDLSEQRFREPGGGVDFKDS